MTTDQQLVWVCNRCNTKLAGNPRLCPKCGYTVYQPTWPTTTDRFPCPQPDCYLMCDGACIARARRLDDEDDEPAPPDQPDGINDESHNLPDPARAANRVRAYIEASGDGLYDVQGGMPLYARDLAALTRAAQEREQLRTEVERLQVLLDHAEQYARDLQDGGIFLHDEAVTTAREWGIAEGLRQATEFVASLLGHDLVLADDADAVGLLAAAISTAREQGRRQATEGWGQHWGVQMDWVQGPQVDPFVAEATREDVERYIAGLPPSRRGIAKVVSRLIGPWEPAEQPETLCTCPRIDVSTGVAYEYVLGRADPRCPVHAEQPEGSDRG